MRSPSVGRVCTPAGVPGGAHAARVDFGPRQQIIESAYAIPDGVSRDGISDEQALAVQFGVFDSRGKELRVIPIRIEELLALLLAQRIPCESDVTPAGKRPERLLPGGVRLAAGFMSQGVKDGGVRRRTSLRKIEIRCDKEAGLAFEDDLFNSVIAAVDGACDARVQRRALGKTA